MVDRIEFKELETEELPVTSSVLLGAAHHLGNFEYILFIEFKIHSLL